MARAGRPSRISREAIVAAASEVVERDGPDALTMRGLARTLGVSPMALYHHVSDRDELLVLVLDASIDAVELPAPDPDPTERIVATAARLRDVLDAHPWIVPLIAPGDRFARRALLAADRIAGAFVELGLEPPDALRAYRAVWFQMLGELTYRHARRRRAATDGLSPIGAPLVAEVDADGASRLAAAR
ncbi:TetR/AcrR family transcriptional regulator, partial [Patulibacter sp. S7RM1-6]